MCCTTIFFSLPFYCTSFLPRIRSRIIINGRGDVFIYGANRLNREKKRDRKKKAATQVGKTNFKGKQKASQSFSIDVFIRSDLNTFSCMSVFFLHSLFFVRFAICLNDEPNNERKKISIYIHREKSKCLFVPILQFDFIQNRLVLNNFVFFYCCCHWFCVKHVDLQNESFSPMKEMLLFSCVLMWRMACFKR